MTDKRNVFEVKADGLPTEVLKADSHQEACEMYRSEHPEADEASLRWRPAAADGPPCYGWKVISR